MPNLNSSFHFRSRNLNTQKWPFWKKELIKVDARYDEILEAGNSNNEYNSTNEEQQPEPKKRKCIKAIDFEDVIWGNKVTMLNEHL